MRAEWGLLVSRSREVLLILFPSEGALRCAGCRQMVGHALLDPADERADLLGRVDERRAGGVRRLPHGDASVVEPLRLDALSPVGPAPRALPALLAEVGGGHAVVDVDGAVGV